VPCRLDLDARVLCLVRDRGLDELAFGHLGCPMAQKVISFVAWPRLLPAVTHGATADAASVVISLPSMRFLR
jgi:hypothetical protein